MAPPLSEGELDRRRRSPSERPTAQAAYGTGAPNEELTELGAGPDDNGGNGTDGTTVVSTTPVRGCADSGATTGFECGGDVTTGRPEGRTGATFNADGAGVNSMGG